MAANGHKLHVGPAKTSGKCFTMKMSYRFVTGFKKKKEELSQHLFKLYNQSVFDNMVSHIIFYFTFIIIGPD